MNKETDVSSRPAKQPYGLFTAITMIVGICIGSGIFFKSDNILVATGGSIPLGVLVFALGAVAIIFGGLSMSTLAARTERPGGALAYAEEFCGKRMGAAFGWFQIFVYYPTLVAVVSWVVGIYACVLFNLEGSLELQVGIGSAFFALCFLYNTLSRRIGGFAQNASTVIKLIPLFVLAVSGLIWGDPIGGLSRLPAAQATGLAWISAIGPIAFSYDGWIVSTSIGHEVRDSKRNLPRALVFAPIFVMLAYVLYFVGVTTYLGPEQVLALGDGHIAEMATQLISPGFAKAITVFVIISVMGTVNGLILGYIRVPYALSLREGMMPFSKKLSVVNEKLDMPVNSALFAFGLSALWMLVHYVTSRYSLLPNSDISEISIATSYLLYVVLYYQVFRLWKRGELGVMRGLVCPALATLGSAFILSGSLQSALFFWYFGFCLLIVAGSQIYYKKK